MVARGLYKILAALKDHGFRKGPEKRQRASKPFLGALIIKNLAINILSQL